MPLDREERGLLKPFAGESSPRSIYLSARMRSTRDCFSAEIPGATTTVSEALLLEHSKIAMRGEVRGWVIAGKEVVRELVCTVEDGEWVLRPKAPIALLLGIAPSAPTGVPVEGWQHVRTSQFGSPF